MSGRKYSQIVLKNTIKEAIECGIELRNAYDRAQSLVHALSKASQSTKELETLRDSGISLLRAAGEELDSLDSRCNESSMRRLKIDQVSEMKRSMQSLKGEIDDLSDRCRRAGEAAAKRIILEALQGHLVEKRDGLEPWLPGAYQVLCSDIAFLLGEIDGLIRKNGAIDSLDGEIEAINARYRVSIGAAMERQKKSREREYIAGALADVCKVMGFKVATLPQKSVVDDLVLEVDTYAYGVMHFRLELEGSIRSQSEMIRASCDKNFQEIEDGLRGLGVVSRFCYEGDQSPVCLRKGENRIPGVVHDPGHHAAGKQK
jgi:hypothetical protein